MKIFGLGFHKTGTSTLRECLRILSYNVCPEEYGYLVSDSAAKGDYRLAIMLAKHYDAFEDSPWNYRGFYHLLDRTFDAKFILTVRNGDRWYDSLLRWCATYGVGNSVHMAATIGVEVTATNRKQVIDLYHQANDQIKEYFSSNPGKLLMLDWEVGDGWHQLCRFLGQPLPSVPLPHKLKYDRIAAKWSD